MHHQICKIIIKKYVLETKFVKIYILKPIFMALIWPPPISVCVFGGGGFIRGGWGVFTGTNYDMSPIWIYASLHVHFIKDINDYGGKSP